MRSRELLAPLDGLEVPDLRDEIRRRAMEADPFDTISVDFGLPAARTRRRSTLRWSAVAVLLVVAAFGAGLAVARRHPTTTVTTSSSTWAVRGHLSIIQSVGPEQPLLTASGTGLWLAVPHGTTLVHVESAGGRLRIDRQVTVPSVLALAADGQHLWILTVSGDLLDLTTGPTPAKVTSFGPLGSSRVTLAVGGGKVWIGGIASGLVAVRADGTHASVPGVAAPATLTATAASVWAIDSAGKVAMVDPESATVRRTIEVGVAVAAVADGSGLWFTREQDGALVHLDDRGHEKLIAANVVTGSNVTRLASTGNFAWLEDSQVLRAFDLSGGPRHTVVVDLAGVDDPDIAAAPGSIWVDDNHLHAINLVTPR